MFLQFLHILKLIIEQNRLALWKEQPASCFLPLKSTKVWSLQHNLKNRSLESMEEAKEEVVHRQKVKALVCCKSGGKK